MKNKNKWAYDIHLQMNIYAGSSQKVEQEKGWSSQSLPRAEQDGKMLWTAHVMDKLWKSPTEDWELSFWVLLHERTEP